MATYAIHIVNPLVLSRRGIAFLIGIGIIIGIGIVIGKPGSTWLAGKLIEHENVAFAVAPKGHQLVFAAADGNLYLFDLKTLQITPFVRSNSQKSAPTFSPDAIAIAYAEGTGDQEGKHLFIRSLDGKQIRQLTRDANVYDTQPAYSPDGSRLVFTRATRRRPYSMGGWTWDQWDLWVVNADGTHLQRITNQKYYQLEHPLFLSKKKQIVYAAYNDGIAALYTVQEQPGAIPKPFGGRPRNGQNLGAWATEPHLSQAGSRLAFISDRETSFQYDIWLMNTDETNMQALGMTSVSRYNQNPVFLPNGQSLVFLAGREWNVGSRPIFSLWEVNIPDKKAHQIADSGLFTDPTHWKPSTK
jgi:Tol biopolymer transport system component